MFAKYLPIKYFPVVFYLSLVDLKKEASQKAIGIIWWLIDPILNTFIFAFLLRVVLRGKSEDLVLFIFVGMVIWTWFGTAVSAAMTSISGNKNFITQIYIPKVILPIRAILTETLKFGIALSLLFIVVIWSQTPFLSAVWVLVPLLIIQFTFILACALATSALVPFVPELSAIFGFFIRAGFFLSGVFFDISRVPEQYQFVVEYNPMARLIQDYRGVFMDGLAPDPFHLWVIFACSLVVILVALVAHQRLDYIFPKIVR
ncbi:MAG: ABC transporter permease [Pseudomonadota bacterium]